MNPIDVFALAGVSHSPSTESARQRRSLSGLSDRELLSRVKELVSRERAVTLEVLVHLIEVERRRLHVGLGYASMFDYCTRHLGYSSSAASRRIQTARCVRDYPEVYGLLEKNEVNLVTVSLVASILTEENAKDLIARIRGKSQREVEAIASAYRPPVILKDRAKPVWVSLPASSAGELSGCPGDLTPTGGSEISPNATAADSAGGPPQADTEVPAQRRASTQLPATRPGTTAPRLEERYSVQFLASERFMKKFERARALLSNRTGSMSYEAVLEAALDEFLKDHDPVERQKRREDRREKAEARAKTEDRGAKKPVGSRRKGGNDGVERGLAEGSSRSSVQAGSGQVDNPLFRRRAGGSPSTRVVRDRGRSRRIPAAVRDAVFARDKGRCTYVGEDGKRCETTHHLQIDHVIPYARGGTNALGNLRLLCERHNKKEAERVLGPNVTGRFRARE